MAKKKIRQNKMAVAVNKSIANRKAISTLGRARMFKNKKK